MIKKTPFEYLPLFFEGNSRILRQAEDPDYLLCKLKPTVFSYRHQGVITLDGIDRVRTETNAILCDYLHCNGIKTSNIATENGIILVRKEKVPPIEVVVKSSLIGSPKHIYKNIESYETRHGIRLIPGTAHSPYVRFDWRNPLPLEDHCLPEGLADHFIDTVKAKETAIKAFNVLKTRLNPFDLDLLDICFFMNEAGDKIAKGRRDLAFKPLAELVRVQ